MEIQDQLSNVHNLQSVVHDYFEELMALNLIIYNTDIINLEMIENNGILITNIEFKSHEDCDLIVSCEQYLFNPFNLLINSNPVESFCLTRKCIFTQSPQKALASLVLAVRDILHSSSESGEVPP